MVQRFASNHAHLRLYLRQVGNLLEPLDEAKPLVQNALHGPGGGEWPGFHLRVLRRIDDGNFSGGGLQPVE